MNIVFIVGSYLPYYSAVGKCVGNVADELSQNHNVTVICQKNYAEQKNVEVSNNQRIIRIDTKENKLRDRLDTKIGKEKGLSKRKYQLVLNGYKLSRILKTIFSAVSIKRELVDKYLNALSEICEPIDLIIPACMPFESVVAASKYIDQEGSKIKMIPYLFDQFAENIKLHRTFWNAKLKRRNHLNLEECMLRNAKSLLIMNQLNEHFKSEFPDYNKKINIVEHPLLKRYPNVINKISNKLNIVYTGSFYKDIRNPEYFLEVVDKVLGHLEAKINIYSFGNCDEILRTYSDRNNSIINHGKVTTEKAYEAISRSDILIAVGNTNSNQVPSKIFEYLSFGKPIIYFYTVDNDVNLKVLKKYPLSLCLKQDLDKLDKNVKRFNEFCDKYAESKIPFEEVEKIYYDATPKYTADLIVELMG